jgi:hypothetical protein
MRNLFVLVLLAAIAVATASVTLRAADEIRLAQNTTPIPLPAPTLNQSFTACSVGCNTQVGSCQGTCLAISSGAATTSSTIVGVTTSPTQCYLNCTSQQLLCQQNCPR